MTFAFTSDAEEDIEVSKISHTKDTDSDDTVAIKRKKTQVKRNDYSGVKKISLRGLKEKYYIVKDNNKSGTSRSSVEKRHQISSSSTTENQQKEVKFSVREHVSKVDKNKPSGTKGSTEMAQIKKLLTSCITNLQKWRNSSGNHGQFVKGEVLQLEGATKLLKQYLDDLQKPWPKTSDKKSKVINCNLCKRTFLYEESKFHHFKRKHCNIYKCKKGCGATFLDIPSQLTHEKQHAKKKIELFNCEVDLVAANVIKPIKRHLREIIMRNFVVYYMNFLASFQGVNSLMLTLSTIINMYILSIA